MRKTLAVARKELRQIRRDPLTLTMLLGVPAMMLLLYGYALNFDVRHVALAVEDCDRSAESRELISAFVQSTYFDLVGGLPSGGSPEELFRRNRARAVLVVPEGYAEKLGSGRTVQVQFLVDGTDSNTAGTILGYAESLTQERNVALLTEAWSRQRPDPLPAAIDYRPRVWFNPELKSTQFLVPGLVGFILMLTAVISTALSVVREKERGTLEQLRITPLRAEQLLLGKTLPYLVISLLATVIILAVARGLFGVEVRGSYLDLFLATLVYLLGALGFGLLISSIAPDQAMAFQAGAVGSMLPAIFLSGFIFPLHNMPEALQVVSYAVPARYYLVILRGVILKGAPLAAYPDQAVFLLLYAVAVSALAWVRLTRREGAA
jgi:ABC-2 type transport system permease protein